MVISKFDQYYNVAIIVSLAVNQNFLTEASNEYVIMGNSALMRCVIPSFVSDFVSVQNWQDETGNVLVSDNNNYGTKYKHRRYFPI